MTISTLNVTAQFQNHKPVFVTATVQQHKSSYHKHCLVLLVYAAPAPSCPTAFLFAANITSKLSYINAGLNTDDRPNERSKFTNQEPFQVLILFLMEAPIFSRIRTQPQTKRCRRQR